MWIEHWGEPNDLSHLCDKAWKLAADSLSKVDLEQRFFCSKRLLSVIVHYKCNNKVFMKALEKLLMHNTYYDQIWNVFEILDITQPNKLFSD